MPKAQVSVLEVEIEASASSALAALDKLEEKLNRVGSALDQIVTAAKSIKDIGNLAQSFKGISSALSAVDKAQKATAKHKNDGKVSNQDLIDRKRLLDDIGKMSASKLLGFGNKNVFNTASGKQLPALQLPTYQDISRMIQSAYGYGGKQLPALISESMLDAYARTKPADIIGSIFPEETRSRISDVIGNINFADALGFGGENPLPERINDVVDSVGNIEKPIDAAAIKANAIDAEFKEIKESVNEASAAVEQFNEKTRDDSLFGTRSRSSVKRKAADVLGERYLHDTPKKSPILERFSSDPRLAKFVETINGELGRTQHTGVKASIGLKELSRMQAEAAATATQQAEAQSQVNMTSEEAAQSTRNLGTATEETTKKVSNSRGVLRQMLGVLAKVGKQIGGLFGSGHHGSKLFGRRGFGGFLSLMLIRRALMTAIRALFSGIKEGSDALTQYSSEYNNSISKIVSALNYLKYAWAAAFEPIVNVVAPYVETFINILASALNAIGRFMAALTGKGFATQAKKTWTDYAASLDKAGSSAGGAGGKMDDLKKTIMSFDEIHALNDPNSSSGGGGGGSGSSGGVNPSDVFETVDLAGDSLADFGKILRDRMLAGDWYGVGDAIAEKMNGIIEKVNGSHWGEKLAERINHFIEAYNGWADNFDWEGLGDAIGTSLNDFFLNFSWTGFSSGIAKTLNGLLHTFNVFASVTHWKDIGANITLGIETFFKQVEWSEIGTAIKNACDALLDFINGAIEEAHPEEIGANIADAIIDGIVDFFMGDEGDAALQRVAHAIINLFRLLFPTIAMQFQDTYEVFAPGRNLYDDILNGVDDFYEDLNERSDTGSQTVMDTVTENVKTPYDDLCRDVVESSGFAVDESQNKWSPFGDWFKDRVTDPLKGHNKAFKDNTIDSAKEAEKGVEYQFKPLDNNLDMRAWKPIQGHANVASANVAAYFATAAANLQLKWQGISGWFDTNVSTPVSTTFNTLSTKIGNAFTSAKTNLTSGWGNVSGWFETHVRVPISNMFGTFKSIGETAASNLRAGLKSITSMPTFHFSWNIEKKVVSLFGHQIVASVPWPKISFYAQGGFPSADLFAANESGNPEMVGRIGTRTAVANNNQITEALKNAMLEGLMQYAMVMNSSKDSTPYQINLVVKTQNDEVLARAVERGNARRNARMYPAGAVR